MSFFKKCSTCKSEIPFEAKYYVCSVSTCNGERTGYTFCRMQCFETHLPGARHRDAGAIEKKAPQSLSDLGSPSRSIVRQSSPAAGSQSTQVSREVLVIASRFKDYVQSVSEMNTSASVMDVLSDYLRVLAERGIQNARSDGRKTLMDRDFEFLRKE